MTRNRNLLRSSLLAWVLALVAVFAQVSGAAALPECCDPAASLATALCGVDHPAAPAAPHHHDQDCAACPLCAAAAVHVALLDTEPDMPLPPIFVADRPFETPPARAPPSAPYHPGQPRGPPILA